MPTPDSDQCRLCGSKQVHYRFVIQQNAVYQCRDCGFLFSLPAQRTATVIPQPAATVAVYPQRAPREHSREPLLRTALGAVARYAAAAQRTLLLVSRSCGPGAAAAQRLGFSVTPCTLPETCEHEAVSFPDTCAVCMLDDVVALVVDPAALLRAVHACLCDQGVLAMITPSVDRGMESIRAVSADGRSGYYTSQTIQNLLAKTGFEQVYVTAVPDNGIPQLLVLARKKPVRERAMLSIIVPVYNEQKTFPELMARLAQKTVPHLDKEIIIVESNSTDGTRAAVEQVQQTPGIRVIFEDRPRGKGHAVRAGLAAATGDFVIIQDGDLEYDINDYDTLLEKLVTYREAFVLGSRHGNGWKMRHFATQPLIALVMNAGQIFFTALINLFCGQRMRDPFTMYKVFRRDCLFNLPLEANRFDFDWELVIKLVRKGYTPLEIPVNYVSRSFHEGKKVSLLRDPLTWIRALLKYRFCPLYERRYEMPE